MSRPLGSLLLSLPLAIVMTAGAAQAQSSRDPRAFPDLMGLFRDNNRDEQQQAQTQAQAQAQAQAQQLPGSNGIESESLPPPGFATPNGAPPPVGGPTGHQFGEPQRYQQPPIQQAPMQQQGAAASAGQDAMRPPAGLGGPPAASSQNPTVMALPEDDQPEVGQPKELPPHLKKQLVDFSTKEPTGTIVVDTANTHLYLVLGGGKALRYGVRVGRDGFTWTGAERISRMKEWPDWHPPAEMIERQPYLPRFMAGGNGNPMGARALYLGSTLYRIHGTNQPSTIGKFVSSGCVGMLNEDVEDLFSRVQVGTRVVVLPGKAPDTVAQGPQAPANPMAPPSANGGQGPVNGPINAAPMNGQTNAGPVPVNPPIMAAPVQQPRR